MLRRLFTLLSAASLLLCVAACALWIRAWARCDYIRFQHVDRSKPNWVVREFDLVSAPDGVHLEVIWLVYRSETAETPFDTVVTEPSGLFWKSGPFRAKVLYGDGFGSVGYDRVNSGYGGYGRRWFEAPHWFVVAVFALTPVVWTVARAHPVLRATRRKARGRCHSCCYDLRASPDRCPECGAFSGCRGQP
jgi:hypothetical protein